MDSAFVIANRGSNLPQTDFVQPRSSRKQEHLWALERTHYAYTASSVSVIRENVISCLHFCVAREAALGVVRLRRLVS